jgi:hypothetical protein
MNKKYLSFIFVIIVILIIAYTRNAPPETKVYENPRSELLFNDDGTLLYRRSGKSYTVNYKRIKENQYDLTLGGSEIPLGSLYIYPDRAVLIGEKGEEVFTPKPHKN